MYNYLLLCVVPDNTAQYRYNTFLDLFCELHYLPPPRIGWIEEIEQEMKLRRLTYSAKEKCNNETCDKIMELQRQGRYDLMNQKTKELAWNENKGIQIFSAKNSQGQIVTNQ